MTLSITGVGLGRTGATMLKIALVALRRGRSRRMSEVLGSPALIAHTTFYVGR